MWKIVIVLLALSYSIESSMMGGRVQVNLSDPSQLEQLTKLARFGLGAISQKRVESSVDGRHVRYSLVNITSAERQLVAGVNNFITIEMHPQECDEDVKQSVVDPVSCELKKEECQLTIWEKPWENFLQLTDFDCQTRRVSGNLGARQKIPNDDSFARLALDFAIAHMNKKSNEAFYFVPLVQNTFKQVVNGIKYTFEFEYAPTSCLIREENMSEFKSDECTVDHTKDSKSCVVSVLDKFWMAETSDVDGDNARYEIMVTNCI